MRIEGGCKGRKSRRTLEKRGKKINKEEGRDGGKKKKIRLNSVIIHGEINSNCISAASKFRKLSWVSPWTLLPPPAFEVSGSVYEWTEFSRGATSRFLEKY